MPTGPLENLEVHLENDIQPTETEVVYSDIPSECFPRRIMTLLEPLTKR